MTVSKLVFSSWLLGVSLLAAPALADIPPVDSCMAAEEGKACNTAGPNGDQPGVCRPDTCTRTTPDGPMSYDCHICQPSSEGAAKKDDDGGCTVVAAPAAGWSGLLASLAAVTLLTMRRRAARRPA